MNDNSAMLVGEATGYAPFPYNTLCCWSGMTRFRIPALLTEYQADILSEQRVFAAQSCERLDCVPRGAGMFESRRSIGNDRRLRR